LTLPSNHKVSYSYLLHFKPQSALQLQKMRNKGKAVFINLQCIVHMQYLMVLCS